MMSEQTITDLNQIQPDWLMQVLRRCGALEHGEITNLDITNEGSKFARIARIQVTYSADAAGRRPASLFLKMCADSGFAGRSEVNYFARDYTGLADAPIPTSYDAQFDEASAAYHILMDDLSATHRNNFETTPDLAYGIAVAEALATLHAYRWGEEGFRPAGGAIPDQRQIDRYIAVAQAGLEPMLAELGSVLDPLWRDALYDIFTFHPRWMAERTNDPSGFTLVHGDPNPGNILSPRVGGGRIYLIDRQPFDWSLTTWLGVHDLTYAIVHPWDIALRREMEWPILEAYHAELVRRGVTDYSWSQLATDYKLCAVQSVYVATEWCSVPEDVKPMKWLWEKQLERALTAFFDLECAALW
jgi:hypothetical protein